jgi:hypothetical protein
MRQWSREPYGLVLVCIGATLALFALGAAVVLAAGHSVPAAFWAVGGITLGILTGLLLRRPGPPDGTLVSGPTPRSSNPTRSDEEESGGAPSGGGPNEPGPAVRSAGDESAGLPRHTPLALVVVLAAAAVFGSALGVWLYAGAIHRTGCELSGVEGTPGCETPLLNLADVFIFLASGAVGALLGMYMPRPPATQPPGEPTPLPDGGGKPPETSVSTGDGGSTPTPPKDHEPGSAEPVTTTAFQLSGSLLVGLAAVVLLGLLALVLLALLPRATADVARAFHIGSLGLIIVAGAFAFVAVASPSGKKQAWVLSAVVTAVLAFITSTASGLVVDRFTSHPPGPSHGVTIKNYVSPVLRTPTVKNYFSPTVKPASVTVNVGAECATYLAHLDDLVDDEPHIASHLPKQSFPVDPGARACGLERPSEVDAIAAVLAAR